MKGIQKAEEEKRNGPHRNTGFNRHFFLSGAKHFTDTCFFWFYVTICVCFPYMLPHNINNGKSELHSWQREKKTRKVTELLKDKSVDHGDRQGSHRADHKDGQDDGHYGCELFAFCVHSHVSFQYRWWYSGGSHLLYQIYRTFAIGNMIFWHFDEKPFSYAWKELDRWREKW